MDRRIVVDAGRYEIDDSRRIDATFGADQLFPIENERGVSKYRPIVPSCTDHSPSHRPLLLHRTKTHSLRVDAWECHVTLPLQKGQGSALWYARYQLTVLKWYGGSWVSACKNGSHVVFEHQLLSAWLSSRGKEVSVLHLHIPFFCVCSDCLRVQTLYRTWNMISSYLSLIRLYERTQLNDSSFVNSIN